MSAKKAALAPSQVEEDTLQNYGVALDQHRAAWEKDLKLFRVQMADCLGRVARMEQQVATVKREFDEVRTDWVQLRDNFNMQLKLIGEHMTENGAVVREVRQQLRGQQELRRATPDLETVLKPLKKYVGELDGKIDMLKDKLERTLEAVVG